MALSLFQLLLISCLTLLLFQRTEAKPHGFKGHRRSRHNANAKREEIKFLNGLPVQHRFETRENKLREEKRVEGQQCKHTKVAVLGAGVAGITAAKALTNNSVTDFLILEYNSEIGGRCRHADFGQDPDGNPYTVELGANWIQGTVSEGGPENPIWTLVRDFSFGWLRTRSRNTASKTSSLIYHHS